MFFRAADEDAAAAMANDSSFGCGGSVFTWPTSTLRPSGLILLWHERHALGSNYFPAIQLLARLAENKRLLFEVHSLLTEDVKTDRRVAQAGEWLLHNFYLIEDQIRTARRHLPKGFSRELPRLLDGPSAGLPRVYDIALETISHGDGRVDLENLSSFVAAYQSVAPLKLGELWAIPICCAWP